MAHWWVLFFGLFWIILIVAIVTAVAAIVWTLVRRAMGSQESGGSSSRR